jgi:hypothetical protein
VDPHLYLPPRRHTRPCMRGVCARQVVGSAVRTCGRSARRSSPPGAEPAGKLSHVMASVVEEEPSRALTTLPTGGRRRLGVPKLAGPYVRRVNDSVRWIFEKSSGVRVEGERRQDNRGRSAQRSCSRAARAGPRSGRCIESGPHPLPMCRAWQWRSVCSDTDLPSAASCPLVSICFTVQSSRTEGRTVTVAATVPCD